MKSGINIHGPRMMAPINSGRSLTFNLAAQVDQSCSKLQFMSNNSCRPGDKVQYLD